ncbi:hypothetical protein B6U66_02515 [Candidatus Bathyarchaeota archaeon ex4484_135]|nr:MAG: hypothetical protein B6U66_02515 [Candidatus Bathyarchaeota archaeon ex4484_135]
MKGPLILIFLLAFLLAPFHHAQAAQEPGAPPQIKEVKFLKWPEVIGEAVEGYVVVIDPDGDLANVTVVFELTGQWAKGVPEDRRIRTAKAENAELGSNKFEFCVSTEGWAPGEYMVVVLAIDRANHTAEYICKDRLALRLELRPPEGALRWAYLGFGLFLCLVFVMTAAFSKVLRPRVPEKPIMPFYPEIY